LYPYLLRSFCIIPFFVFLHEYLIFFVYYVGEPDSFVLKIGGIFDTGS